MVKGETKSEAFKRLANRRVNRVLGELRLIGNLSNRSNYNYTESEIKTIFSNIEEELRLTKSRFAVHLRKGVGIKI
jgi:hypothetical protein